jgi:hypothetical protein
MAQRAETITDLIISIRFSINEIICKITTNNIVRCIKIRGSVINNCSFIIINLHMLTYLFVAPKVGV